MPINPKNKKLYPSNWQTEIRPAILDRAGHCCEMCGVENYAVGTRDNSDGYFVHAEFISGHDCYGEPSYHNYVGKTYKEAKAWCARCGDEDIVIVLTIAHLDHDPTNNDPSNLRALCQRCHNRHDRAHRQANASKMLAEGAEA